MKKILLSLLLLGTAFSQVRAQNTAQSSINSSYNEAGVNISISKSYSATSLTTNFNVFTVNVGTVDASVVPNPIVTNATLTVINNSPTNTPNFILIGNTVSNYDQIVYPQRAAQFVMKPGADSALHLASSNGTQSVTIFWPPPTCNP